MGAEATEEMLTEVSNAMFDAIIMQDKSTYNLQVQQLMEQGMTKEEAEKKAFGSFVGQVALAGAGGALSGGVMGGIANVGGYAANNKGSAESVDYLLDGIVENAQKNAASDETESTSVNTDPAKHTPEEQRVIEEYQSHTDERLKNVFEEYNDNPDKAFSRHTISEVSERQAVDASEKLGGNYEGYLNAINSNGIRHILNEHGPNGAVIIPLLILTMLQELGMF